jgi:3-carboxy-cis,cis-muconate cycloisomerase
MGQQPGRGDGLFGALFGSPAIAAVVGDRAWLVAMLDVERALAVAGERAGVVPARAAADIAAACDPERFDIDDLGSRALRSGNPVVPLAAELEARVADEARPYVHLGATSQDILDTAMSLIARRALDVILDDLTAIAETCAALASTHRATVMAARTLLQQAAPTTFGLRCAGWLMAIDESRASVGAVRDQVLAVQLGGAVGTLASLDGAGIAVTHHLAVELGLVEPTLPWHTNRVRVAELATTLGIVAGVLGKIALDVELLAQTELAEVTVEGALGAGGSSTLPHKRNPVSAVLTTAMVRRIPGLVGTVLSAMPQEHERAAGNWHAEWETITELLRLVGAAAAQTRAMLGGLQVDASRMRAGVELTRGLIMAESVATRLARSLGRGRAHELVERCCREAVAGNRPLRDVLLAEPAVGDHLSADEVVRALEPDAYLGVSDALIDRALAAHRSVLPGRTPTSSSPLR